MDDKDDQEMTVSKCRDKWRAEVFVGGKSITHISRTDEGENYGTNEKHGEKEWRDGRDLNPRIPEKATVA